MKSQVAAGTAALVLASTAQAQSPYKIDTSDNIKAAAKSLAFDLMSYYKGNQSGQIAGVLPGPPPGGDYYWWEAGALWGTMVDYWFYTGDTTYNEVLIEGVLHQTGDNLDFMPINHTASLGNDDQGFWGMTAMLAAENRFPDPPAGQAQWLALAQAVFNTQADPSRHDQNCGGGLRWQIPFANRGYDYKNTIANAIFMNIGARLAKYTGNMTYFEHAEQTWNWLESVGYIDAQTYEVYDGGHVTNNCTDINHAQFSYNSAVLIQSLAYMYNLTQGEDQAKWKGHIEKLTATCLKQFFPDNIAFELSCEGYDNQCTIDMLSFKGYVARWLTQATRLAPFMRETILPVLRNSAEAAVKQCYGGADGRTCGFRWSKGAYDGMYGVGAGQQMNVLAAVTSLLLDESPDQVTDSTGGTSKGDVNAGSNSDNFLDQLTPVTAGDKAGASILTIMLLVSAVGTFSWMSLGG